MALKRLVVLAAAGAVGLACSGGSGDSNPFGMFGPAGSGCRALFLLAEHSDMLPRGRVVSVSAKLYRLQSGTIVPDSISRISWFSENPVVLRVHGGNRIEGVSVGSAKLTVMACDLAQTFTVEVLPQGYEITFLGDSTVGAALNDSGEVAGLDSPNAASGWLWRNGTRVPTQGCRPKDLNNSARVLCAGTGPTTWSAGVLTNHDTVSRFSVALNDSGHVLMHSSAQGAAIRWRAPGDHVESGNFMLVSGMNNRGDVVGSGGFDRLYPDAYVWRLGGGPQSLPGFGRYSSAGDINAAGVVVGGSEYMNGGGANQSVAVIWSASGSTTFLRDFEGPFPNPIAWGAMGINDAGEVVANGSKGGVLWSQGKLGILTDMVSDPDWQIVSAQRINAKGQVLASVRNTVTGQVGAALLTPP